MKLLAVRDKKDISFLSKYDIFLCRGRGYKRILICSAYNSYISLHPFHSHHDIIIHSDIELHKINEVLITTVYYYEKNSADVIINDNITIYESIDHGRSWFEIKPDCIEMNISKTTLIDRLNL